MLVGLQVGSKQIGLVWETRWPTGSCADRMVAITRRRSLGQFHGWTSKPRSSRDDVRAESWVEIGGRQHQYAGFVVVQHKTTRLLGWATKPRTKTRRWGPVTQAGSTTQEGRADHLGQSNRPRGLVWPPESQPSRSYEAEGTRHGCKSCIGPTQACGGCASVYWCWIEDFKNYLWGLVSLVC
jgi:hypothetical protein